MAFWISVFCCHSTYRMLLLIYLIIIKTYKVIPGIKRPHFNDLFSFFNWETRNSSQLVDWTVIEEWKYGGHFFIVIVLIITIVTNTSAVYNCSMIELTSINKFIHQPLQQDTSLPRAIKRHKLLSYIELYASNQSVSQWVRLSVCLSIHQQTFWINTEFLLIVNHITKLVSFEMNPLLTSRNFPNFNNWIPFKYLVKKMSNQSINIYSNDT